MISENEKHILMSNNLFCLTRLSFSLASVRTAPFPFSFFPPPFLHCGSLPARLCVAAAACAGQRDARRATDGGESVRRRGRGHTSAAHTAQVCQREENPDSFVFFKFCVCTFFLFNTAVSNVKHNLGRASVIFFLFSS
jgi:hypothetical protein